MTDYAELVKRLDAVATHDWRTSILAHTPDTAAEAKAAIEAQAARIEVDGQCMAALEREKAAAEAEAAKLRAERDNERIWKTAALNTLTETGERLTKVEAERDEAREHLTAALKVHKQYSENAEAQLVEAVEVVRPFSDMAGEMFARNWNAEDLAVALDNPGEPHRVSAGDFFRARDFLAKHGDKP